MLMRPERVVPKLIFIERSLQTGKRMNLPQIQLRLQRPEMTFDTTTALKAISEVGTDMSRFKSAKHFASWLGLCPRTKISGEKLSPVPVSAPPTGRRNDEALTLKGQASNDGLRRKYLNLAC